MRQAPGVLCGVFLVLAAAPSAFSITASEHEAHGTRVGIKVVRPATAVAATESFAQGVRTEVDRLTGAVRLVEGQLDATEISIKGDSPAVRAALIAAAKAYADVNADVFGVSAKDLVLVDDATLVDEDVQFLKFNVTRAGTRVEDAFMDFRFKRGKLVQVVNQSFAEATLAALPEVKAASLARAAKAAVLGEDATLAAEHFRVRQTKDGYELVKVARFDTKTATDRLLVEVLGDGSVFEIRPTVFNLDGNAAGQIFPRYYQDAVTTVPYSELTLVDASGNVTTGLDGNFTGASDAAQPKLDGFTGNKIKIVLRSGTKVVASGSRIRDRWSVVYNRGTDPVSEDKSMAQSMVFHHGNAMVQRAKAYIASPWLEGQLTANVNLTQTCNAHWDGSTINFYSAGGGCANTGNISDVVFHEWGHGLDANTGGIADGAFSEGFGDIMSLIMTESNVLGIGFRNDGRPVRDLAPDKVYPRDATGGVHAEGLIIGSTFFDLYTALVAKYDRARAVDLLSKYALKAVFTATRYTDVYNALKVIDDDDANPGNGTPNYCILNKTFTAHGLATADAACELASIEEVRVDDRAGGNGNGILEPGESASLWFKALNGADADVTGLNGQLTVDAASGVSVVQGAVRWAVLPARSGRVSDTAAEITVADTVACGATITGSLALASGDRTASLAQVLSIGRNAGEAATFAATGLPAQILDNATAEAPLTIEGAQWNEDTTVHTARLKLDVTHPYAGDLTVSLVAPDGTVKEILRGSGSDDDIHIDEDVTEKLKGLKGAGTWKLQVTDGAAQDQGTLDAVELTLTPAYFECQ